MILHLPPAIPQYFRWSLWSHPLGPLGGSLFHWHAAWVKCIQVDGGSALPAPASPLTSWSLSPAWHWQGYFCKLPPAFKT